MYEFIQKYIRNWPPLKVQTNNNLQLKHTRIIIYLFWTALYCYTRIVHLYGIHIFIYHPNFFFKRSNVCSTSVLLGEASFGQKHFNDFYLLILIICVTILQMSTVQHLLHVLIVILGKCRQFFSNMTSVRGRLKFR